MRGPLAQFVTPSFCVDHNKGYMDLAIFCFRQGHEAMQCTTETHGLQTSLVVAAVLEATDCKRCCERNYVTCDDKRDGHIAYCAVSIAYR